MSWVTIVPVVVVILLVLNSIYVVFWLRPKHSVKSKDKIEKTWRRKARPEELFMSILVIICGLAPVVAPTSQIAKWIAEYGIMIYVAWCFIGIVALGVIFKLIGLTLGKINWGQSKIK